MRRLPELFAVTVCGLEFPDYGIRPGDILRLVVAPVHHDVEAVSADDPIPYPRDEVSRCLVCEEPQAFG